MEWSGHDGRAGHGRWNGVDMMAGLVTGAYAGLAMVGMLPPEMEWSGHDGRAGHGSQCWSTNFRRLRLVEVRSVHLCRGVVSVEAARYLGVRPYQDKRAASGGDGHSHEGETVARGHHQMPMRQRSSGSNPQVRKEQGGEGHATYEEPLLLPCSIQCNGSGGTHTRG